MYAFSHLKTLSAVVTHFSKVNQTLSDSSSKGGGSRSLWYRLNYLKFDIGINTRDDCDNGRAEGDT